MLNFYKIADSKEKNEKRKWKFLRLFNFVKRIVLCFWNTQICFQAGVTLIVFLSLAERLKRERNR